MYKPRFYTLPGNEAFAPSPAHPGEDAGADIKAFVSEFDLDDLEAAIAECRNRCAGPVAAAKAKPVFYLDGIRFGPDLVSEVSGAVTQAGGCVVLRPGETKLVETGFKVALPAAKDLKAPFKGFVPTYQIVPRSGLALKFGIDVANSPGIIDAGYRDFVRVILVNNSNDYHVFTHGARIAQGLVALVVDQSDCEVVTDEALLGETDRGTGGFGSTSI